MTERRPAGVSVVRRLPAGREVVFDLLADPLEFSRWFGMTAGVDAGPDGWYCVPTAPGEFCAFSYLAIKRPSRLDVALRWTSRERGAELVGDVRFTLRAVASGTSLRLVHRLTGTAPSMRNRCSSCGDLVSLSEAFSCSHECTYCVACARRHHLRCPRCTGRLTRRAA